MIKNAKTDTISLSPVMTGGKEFELMKQLAKLSVLAIVISAIGGCGWLWGKNGYFRNRSNDYLEARQVADLQVPTNLQNNTRPFDPLYPIPVNVANSTSGKDFEVPRPIALQVVNSSQSFALQSNAGRQWFVTQRSPALVYPQILQYFQQAGFSIDVERPQVGEFITTWTKSTSLTDMLSGRLLAVDPSLNEQEIRVRVSVKSGVQANTSEVYTVVMARNEGSMENSDWPTKSQNVSVESVLLDELMANMSNTQASDTTVSLLTDNAETNNSSALTGVTLSRVAGTPTLMLTGDFDLVWSRIERAITTANIKIDDMDRTTGMYYINLAEKADGSDGPGLFKRIFTSDSQADKDARAERYLLKVTQSGNAIDVTVHNPTNNLPVAADKAEVILKLLKENIN